MYVNNVDLVKSIVERHFTVSDVYLDAGILTFKVYDEDVKEKFRNLYKELKQYDLIPTATREDGRTLLRIFPKPRIELSIPKSRILPLLLFVATLATVSIDGYLRSSTTVYEIITGKTGFLDRFLDALLFAVALMSIIGVHELGHKISARIDYMESSPPYFIPGIPTMIPTFGALIFQKSPIINKDDMFDIGISGPIAGFIVSIGVLFISFMTARWIPVTEYDAIVDQVVAEGGFLLPSPLIFYLARSLFGRPDMVPLFSTIGFAAWLGMLVTALNLFPAWQLDGGRVFRSFLSRRQHRIAGYISVVILAVTGYFFFAILILLMMPRTPDIPPLDQVSPLSKKRKIAISLVIAILVLTFIPLRFI